MYYENMQFWRGKTWFSKFISINNKQKNKDKGEFELGVCGSVNSILVIYRRYIHKKDLAAGGVIDIVHENIDSDR